MIRRVNAQYFGVGLLFLLCQVIGTTCIFPDISMAEEGVMFVEEGMACPMGEGAMCPPALVSSSERKTVENSKVIAVDHATILRGPARGLTIPLTPTLWSRSSGSSIVPLSIAFSSVLRI